VPLRRKLVILAAVVFVAGFVAVAAPGQASATWCWPSPAPTCSTSSYGLLGIGTTTGNGCWYAYSEICSGYDYFINDAINKLCYPDYICSGGVTSSTVLYGFENAQRIRGRYTNGIGTWQLIPSDVGMGGYLRAQEKWDYGCCGNDNQLRASALA